MLYEYSEKIQKLFEYLKEIKEINLIIIICVFLQKEIFEKYQEKDKIVFKSIYCGKAIENYKKFILAGGYNYKMEGEYSNNINKFSENNFEGKLAELIEINKKI